MSVSDNFNRANGGLGANWTSIKGVFTIVSNQAQDDGSVTLANGAFWNANSFNADHTSAVTILNVNTYVGVGARLKNHGDGQVDGYIYFGGLGQIQVIADGANTNIGAVTAAVANDVIKIGCVGTTITAYINGVSAGSVTDSTWDGTNTNAGLADYGNGATLTYDDWQGTGEVTSVIATIPFNRNVGHRPWPFAPGVAR